MKLLKIMLQINKRGPLYANIGFTGFLHEYNEVLWFVRLEKLKTDICHKCLLRTPNRIYRAKYNSPAVNPPFMMVIMCSLSMKRL